MGFRKLKDNWKTRLAKAETLTEVLAVEVDVIEAISHHDLLSRYEVEELEGLLIDHAKERVQTILVQRV